MNIETAFVDEIVKIAIMATSPMPKAPIEFSFHPTSGKIPPGSGHLTSPGWLMRLLGAKRSKLLYHDPVYQRIVKALHEDPESLEELRRKLYKRESKLKSLSELMS